MAIRWQFVEDTQAPDTSWTWRVLLLDGTIQTHSQRFKSYGAAVGDAIRNGFRPSQHHWIVVTRHIATHFRPGEPHVVVPVTLDGGSGRGVVPAPGTKAEGTEAEQPRPSPGRPIKQ